MIKTINLTEEHLKLIPFFFLQTEDENQIVIDKRIMYNLGSHLLEDMANILGYKDAAIKGTETDPDGRAYPEDITEHMLEIHKYITSNLFEIETLIHQFAICGGITAGSYKCKDNELLWTKID